MDPYCEECLLVIKVKTSPSFHLCICEGVLADLYCEELLMKLIVDVRHRQTSELACVVLAGTIADARVLEGARCRYCGTE